MLDLATIGIAFDTSGLKEGQTELGNTGAAADKASKSVDQLGPSMARSDAAMRLATTAVKGLVSAWASYKVLDHIREAAMLNARYQELSVVMTVVGQNAGYNATEMENAAKGMQKLGISMIESRNTTVQLAQAQISLADSGKLARIAQDAAVIGNTNSSAALAQMIHGIKTGQTDVLRTVGINVSFEQSYKTLAAQLGITTSALSEHQKMQARENAVIEEGSKITGAYEAAMTTAGKQMRSMARYTEDLKVMRGEVFNEALTLGVMAFVDQLKDANHEMITLENNGKIKEWGENIASTFAFVVDSALSVVSVFQIVGSAYAHFAAVVGNNAIFEPMNATRTKAQRDEARKAIDDAYREDVDAAAKLSSAMRTALEERRAGKKADIDKRLAMDADYAAKSLAVAQAYSGASLKVQQQAQLALAKGMFPDQYPDKPKDGDNGDDAKGSKETMQAIKKAKEYIESLREQTLEIGLDTVQVKMLAAAHEAAVAPTAKLRREIMDSALAYAIKSAAEAEQVKAKKELEEQAKATFMFEQEARSETNLQIDQIREKTAGIRKQIEVEREAADSMGLTKIALADLAAAKLEVEAVDADWRAALAGDIMQNEELAKVFRDQAAAIRDRAAALRGNAKTVTDKDEETANKARSANLSKSIEDGLMNGFRNGKTFGDIFLDELKAQFGKTILSPIIKPIAEFGSSIISSGLKGLAGMFGLPSFAVGTDYVPRDMVAQIHKGERIVPAAENKAGARSGQNSAPVAHVTNNFTVGDVATVAMVRQAVAGSEQRISAGMQRSMNYGGAM